MFKCERKVIRKFSLEIKKSTQSLCPRDTSTNKLVLNLGEVQKLHSNYIICQISSWSKLNFKIIF